MNLQPRAIPDLLLPDVLVVEDLAKHLRVSRATARRLLQHGVIVGKKVGRRWYLTRQELLCFLASPSIAPTALRLVGDDDVGNR